MRAPILNFFKKAEPARSSGEKTHAHRSGPFPSGKAAQEKQDLLFKAMPSWWMVALAYCLAVLFCYWVHQFFLWFPPYLKEVFKNLRGLPLTWADLGLFWAEKGLIWIAILAAIYHNLWQVGTRYRLTSHDLHIENWFPLHRITSVPYGSVRKLSFQQSLFGLAMNYGHIEIDTGSPTGPVMLYDCPRPKEFLAALQPKVEAVLQPHLAHRRSSDQ